MMRIWGGEWETSTCQTTCLLSTSLPCIASTVTVTLDKIFPSPLSLIIISSSLAHQPPLFAPSTLLLNACTTSTYLSRNALIFLYRPETLHHTASQEFIFCYCYRIDWGRGSRLETMETERCIMHLASFPRLRVFEIEITDGEPM